MLEYTDQDAQLLADIADIWELSLDQISDEKKNIGVINRIHEHLVGKVTQEGGTNT